MPTLYSLAKFCHGGSLHHMTIEQIDLGDANETLGGMDAAGRIRWAWENFGTGLTHLHKFWSTKCRDDSFGKGSK